MIPQKPIQACYWVEPGRLLAGQYPGHFEEAAARERLRRFVQAGVTFFLDLTEQGELHLTGELRPYAPWLAQEAAALGRQVVHSGLSIPDFNIPQPVHMQRILDTLDGALEDGHLVYLHCLGGIGRTGTVVGCYLVRHGLAGQAALDRIADLLAETPHRGCSSPETEEQRQMVLGWSEVGG